MDPSRLPLYYTFGNHMHWVDMQWLWGYGVLPGSTADMLHLCRETGARGNVNFDAIGYEKMAAECPGSLADLRGAIAEGTIEPVGCSYGQPYGLFHGGESNVRQFVFGAAGVRRLLGARPRTFWEEEFYFYPQLPQVLRSCGYTGACLFFQWTWHTPEVPRERASLIEWEGIDGTRIPTLPRNDLNVHQWPEDFDGLLEQGLVRELDRPAVVQWLELMPSKDWMCRSEVLLPRLKQLMGDARFDVRARTAGQLIEELRADAAARRVVVPVRKYGPDDVWHGMTLGKNGDAHPRASSRAEQAILAAEALSTVASVMGRPYASWDVYPTWELDEAWREALAAQHHDNHECEGLCGFVGHGQLERAERLADEVRNRAVSLLALRTGAKNVGAIRTNGLGWARRSERSGERASGVVPPFGYRVGPARPAPATKPGVRTSRTGIELRQGAVRVLVGSKSGTIEQIHVAGKPVLGPRAAIGGLSVKVGEREVRFDHPKFSIDRGPLGVALVVTHTITKTARLEVRVSIPDSACGVDVATVMHDRADPMGCGPRPEAGMNAALQMSFRPGRSISMIHADAPYSVHEVRGSGRCRRKYPMGDWMTSPQWFEELRDPFCAQSFVDITGETGPGLLIAHDGSQQWFRDEHGVRTILTAYDPWDEGRYTGRVKAGFRLIPHAGTADNAARVRLAAEYRADSRVAIPDATALPVGGGTGDAIGRIAPAPGSFGMLDVDGGRGVLAHALYRESEKTGEHLAAWAGHEMARKSGGACTHPVVIRLVEWNGEPADVVLKLPGPVAAAAKTNLLGEVGPDVGGGSDTAWLRVEPAKTPAWAKGVKIGGRAVMWSQVRFTMRPREIATIMADVVTARKAWRDLDAKRRVWATVHKAEGTKRSATKRRRG
ncbi:MAG: hypothetical protein IT438_03775 [Phycisphaerales bacterium]|nr:hypothetical protein [Phycisphaerales bacterium]